MLRDSKGLSDQETCGSVRTQAAVAVYTWADQDFCSGNRRSQWTPTMPALGLLLCLSSVTYSVFLSLEVKLVSGSGTHTTVINKPINCKYVS